MFFFLPIASFRAGGGGCETPFWKQVMQSTHPDRLLSLGDGFGVSICSFLSSVPNYVLTYPTELNQDWLNVQISDV